MRLLIVCAALTAIFGCSTQNIKQGFYEGLRVRNDLQSSPSERVGKPDSPSYQDYERLKKEQPTEPLFR